MKKSFLLSLALLVFSVPTLAFSLSQRLDATYSVELDNGWDFGIQGQVFFSPNPAPPDIPLAISYRIRPYVRYTTHLIETDELNLSAFVRARLSISRDVVPAPIQQPSIGLGLQSGLDLTYYLSENLSLVSGLELDATLASNSDFSLSGYSELDLELDGLDLYGGLSLDEIVPTRAVSLYAGLTSYITRQTSLNLEASYAFANPFRSDDFSLTWRLSFRFD